MIFQGLWCAHTLSAREWLMMLLLRLLYLILSRRASGVDTVEQKNIKYKNEMKWTEQQLKRYVRKYLDIQHFYADGWDQVIYLKSQPFFFSLSAFIINRFRCGTTEFVK